MPEGDCQYCGVHYKAVQVHEPRCKMNPDNIKDSVVEGAPSAPPEEPEHHTDNMLNTRKPPVKRRFWQRKPKTDNVVLQPEQDYRSDEEKFKDFFGNLPEWTPPKQGVLSKLFGKGQQFKTCVFVGDGEEPKVVYVPFDPTLKVLKTDDGRIFDKPLEGKVLFFNKDKFLPLINTRPVDEIYDVPQHFALSLYNGGLGEGQSGGLKDLIEQLRQQQLIQKGLIISFVVVAIAFVLITKSYGEAVAHITGFAETV